MNVISNVSANARPGPQEASRTERTCSVCRKSFAKIDHLTRHLRGHTNERPFGCSTCGKAYTRSDTLLRHRRSHAAPTARTHRAAQRTGTRSSGSTPSDTLNEQQDTLQVSTLVQSAISPTCEPSSFLPPPQTYDLDVTPVQVCSSTSTGPSLAPPSQHGFDFTNNPFNESNPDPFSLSWQLAANFDINALDNALSVTMTDWAQVRFDDYPITAPPLLHTSPPPLNPSSDDTNLRCEATNTSTTHLGDMMSKQWFTALSLGSSRLQSRAASEEPAEQAQVNERYRDRLSRTMTPRSYETAIPPVEYLSLYLRLYSLRFHPVFPMIHLATFRPDSEHSLLFLSMCSLGSLFVRGSGAALQGRGIFERLNKVILASWETHLARNESAALIMTQAAVLGQTFGMLSGRPKDLTTVDTFHGTLLAWVRRFHVQNDADVALSPSDLTEEGKDRKWKDWVSGEQKIRLCLALLIHDAELASLLHYEPTLRWSTLGKLPRLANDALFNAVTATTWYDILTSQKSNKFSPFPALRSWVNGPEDHSLMVEALMRDSMFNAYSILESIQGAIIEARHSKTLDTFKTEHFQDRLLVWYDLYSKQIKEEGVQDPHQLRILWHCTFMTLYADLDTLEMAIGRDGSAAAPNAIDITKRWASTIAAVRCLYHCLLLQDQVDRMCLGSEPALHIPRAIFSAGLVALSYSNAITSPDRQQWHWNATDTEFPETTVMGETAASALLSEARAIVSAPFSSPKCLGLIHGFIDLLQKFDRWGLSQSLARVLSFALEGAHEAGR